MANDGDVTALAGAMSLNTQSNQLADLGRHRGLGEIQAPRRSRDLTGLSHHSEGF